ncbi:NfeD family protein [Nodosilinea sp. E11]|uniref:NfeD family protein n=1 Tax=Nodosilinea sp. E11 TaxID=3037479 RepID=UPI002934ACCA|nr:NfeD family protein [Nodosilinea sp. E11]WOD37279.1 NfeD family protein [Nodosilinea sp. E11]
MIAGIQMNKRVVLRLNYQLIENRYLAVAEIGNEGESPSVEIQGWLPALSNHFLKMLEDWRIAFSNLDLKKRLKVKKVSVGKVPSYQYIQPYVNISSQKVSWNETCEDLASKLSSEMNAWLNSQGFCRIKEKIQQELKFNENLQIIIRADDASICRLPWNCWEFLAKNSNSEISFSLASESYKSTPSRQFSHLEGLKILAVMGDNEGLDLDRDRQILENQLFEKFSVFLQVLQPSSEELKKELKNGSWDMLFFSGHSETLNGEGVIYLRNGESVYLSGLASSFSEAISKGLKLAIFNSCDGIGIAKSVQDLQIPQAIVMRELVPDKVAHDFLSAYVEGIQNLNSDSPLYLAERYARDKIKHSLPCADWLPVIFQNHKDISPVRGMVERPISQSSIDNKISLYEKIGITPEIQFGENINRDKEFKVTVIDPLGESSVGKIKYKGVLWKARVFPLVSYGKIGPIFPGDEVCVVAREGGVCLVLPKHLAHSDLFNKSKKEIELGIKREQVKNHKISRFKHFAGTLKSLSNVFRLFQ